MDFSKIILNFNGLANCTKGATGVINSTIQYDTHPPINLKTFAT